MKHYKLLSLIFTVVFLLSLCSPLVLATGETAVDDPDAAANITTQADKSEAPILDPLKQVPVLDGSEHTVNAKAAMLVDLKSGQVVFAQDPDLMVYPASLTKIMTCLLAIENGNLTDILTVSETALANLDAAGSTAGLQIDEQMTLEEILYCTMLSSANEACNVIAEYVSGSVDDFIALMNQRAAELGCTGTHFANTHGLHDENHYTTVRDLGLIAQEALKSEVFTIITSAVTHTVPATNLSEERNLTTTNFLINPEMRYYYKNAAGVKTGYTTPAGRCLVSTAESGKLRFLSVICGAQDVALENGEWETRSFTETKALFEYGFGAVSYSKVLSTLYPIAQVPVLFSAGTGEAVLAPDSEVTALLPSDFDEKEIEQTITLDAPSGVEAPIAKGQTLGSVSVTYRGRFLGSANLVAITDIARSEIAAQTESTKNFFSENWLLLLVLLLLLVVIFYLIVLSINRARAKKQRKQQRERERLRKNRDVIDFPGNQSTYNEDE